MIRSYLLFLLLLLPLLLPAQPEFSFEGETLQFSLASLSTTSDTLLWSVTGNYYFSNLHNEALSRMVWFPVPSSEQKGFAEILELRLIEPGDSMQVKLLRQTEQGFSFRLDLPRRSFAGVCIRYTQRISGKEAQYVLLTTNSWGRPLPSSEISLTLEGRLELDYLSYPNDIVALCNGEQYYHWQWLDFVPDQDFIVRVK